MFLIITLMLVGTAALGGIGLGMGVERRFGYHECCSSRPSSQRPGR